MVDVRVGSNTFQLSITADGIQSVQQPAVQIPFRDIQVVAPVYGVGVLVRHGGVHPGWTFFQHDMEDVAAWAPLVASRDCPHKAFVPVHSPWAVVAARAVNDRRRHAQFVAIDTHHKTLAACDATGRQAWAGRVPDDLEAAVICQDSQEAFGLLACPKARGSRAVLAWPLRRADLQRLRRAAAGVRLPLRYAGAQQVSLSLPPMQARPAMGFNEFLTTLGVPLGVVMDVEDTVVDGGGGGMDDAGNHSDSSLGEAETDA